MASMTDSNLTTDCVTTQYNPRYGRCESLLEKKFPVFIRQLAPASLRLEDRRPESIKSRPTEMWTVIREVIPYSPPSPLIRRIR